MSNQIELKIDSAKLRPQQFIEAAQSFVTIVQGVAKNISGHLVVWVIEVDKGSDRVRMVADRPGVEYEKSIDAVTHGLKALRGEIREIPYGFSPIEMAALRSLAALRTSEGMRDISITSGSVPESVPENIIPLIDFLTTRQKHEEFGSIEGTIANVSFRQGFICTIQDPIEQRDILCYLQNQECQEQVMRAGLRRARVLADGLVHYSEQGFPVSITADYIRVFPDETELPGLEDIQAIYKSYK
ncbi:MAG TPA: hypothetical protein VH619_16625 [Verrucomicrobiae bacterium]|jgi:hypothetical protein|nr:hypothetical protein [Verrucomicrobiae bacterium]